MIYDFQFKDLNKFNLKFVAKFLLVHNFPQTLITKILNIDAREIFLNPILIQD